VAGGAEVPASPLFDQYAGICAIALPMQHWHSIHNGTDHCQLMLY
jgi:hypothetical protein